jgi:hypothetical protein
MTSKIIFSLIYDEKLDAPFIISTTEPAFLFFKKRKVYFFDDLQIAQDKYIAFYRQGFRPKMVLDAQYFYDENGIPVVPPIDKI